MKSLVALIPAVLMVVGCATQDVAPTPISQATGDPALNTAFRTALPTSTLVAPTETPLPISTPTVIPFAIQIVVPTPLPPGTPLPQFWRLETAVRPQGSGNITLSPQQEDQLYFLGSSIEATANCDADFLRWEGDIPDGSDKTANPITITMDRPRVLYAFCAESLPTPAAAQVPTPTLLPPTATPVPTPTLAPTPTPTLVPFMVRSEAFPEDGAIPTRYTCEGDDVSPALSWSTPPAGTQTVAFVMEDLDAPGGAFDHWVLFNLPPGLDGLPEKLPGDINLANGGIQGRNSFGSMGYRGPCPLKGPPHTYKLSVYAVDRELSLPAVAIKEHLQRALQGHVIASSMLVRTYQGSTAVDAGDDGGGGGY